MTVLVTGGVRSGKSTHAEGLLAQTEDVVYIAPGPVPGDMPSDADWAARVAAHRVRRPATWSTLETGELATAVTTAGWDGSAVLVDCLGTWLTRLIDDIGPDAAGWVLPLPELTALIDPPLDELAVAVRAATTDVVLVTNEVGMGLVPGYRSGRLFRDLLGTVNQRVAAACDEVHLVVSGRVLVL